MSILTIDIETLPQARFLDPTQFPHEPFCSAATWPGALCYQAVGHEGDHLYESGEPGWARDVRAGHMKIPATGVPAALHPTTCRVVQVSFGWRQNGDVVTDLVQWDDAPYVADPFGDEADATESWVLAQSLNRVLLARGKDTLLVSFNGKGFDLPIMRWRAALLRRCMTFEQRRVAADVPWRFLLHPYDDRAHLDLRLLLGNGDRRAHGTLQWWADALGVPARECGHLVQGWIHAGDWGALRQYGHDEARSLVLMYEALGVEMPRRPAASYS